MRYLHSNRLFMFYLCFFVKYLLYCFEKKSQVELNVGFGRSDMFRYWTAELNSAQKSDERSKFSKGKVEKPQSNNLSFSSE